jgi:hypothetical protein
MEMPADRRWRWVPAAARLAIAFGLIRLSIAVDDQHYGWRANLGWAIGIAVVLVGGAAMIGQVRSRR